MSIGYFFKKQNNYHKEKKSNVIDIHTHMKYLMILLFS